MSRPDKGRRVRRLRPQPRLQTRIIIGIGAVALSLSLGLGVATFFLVRSSLIDERESVAVSQVVANGGLVLAAVRGNGVAEAQVLASLRPHTQSSPLLYRNTQWFTASLQQSPDELPEALVKRVLDGSSAKQRFRVGGQLFLGVGVPLSETSAYFEVFSLEQLNDELATLRDTLFLTGLLATGVGLGLGAWVSRRVTRPLMAVGLVAARIADGHLETRLDTSADQDLRSLTSSFNRMADSLQARIERESRFAADVSHELRSPLTTLLTSVTVLENRRHELSEDGRQALDLLSSDVSRLEKLVADLIEVAKHDAGTAEVSWTYIAAPEIALSILRRLRVDDSLRVSASAAGATVRVDEQRLERVIVNLVENAEGHGEGLTGVALDSNEDSVFISVEDEGPGVPDTEKFEIFERFARGSNSRRRASRGGSGLGLALAAENLMAMGGTLSVQDNLPQGARFVISLPRVQP